MGSLIDELQRREAAAREEAEELRGRIAQLAECLAGVEERLSRLVIARETVDEVLSGSGPDAPLVAMPEETVPSRLGHLSPVGVLAVPPWRGPPRVFRTAKLSLFHAASCRFRYSSRASCGVRYPSPE